MRTFDTRRELVEGVLRRRQEIVEAVLTRVHAIGTPAFEVDSEYREGLRLAVVAAVDHTIEAAISGDDRAPPVPGAVLTQARLAARRRIPLETMLRRYLAGHALVGDFTMEEAQRQDLDPSVLRRVLRAQAARTDQALAAISANYLQEEDSARPISPDLRRAERVRRLIDGELVDTNGLAYEFDHWHIALVAKGPEAAKAVEAITAPLDARRLVVPADGGVVWAWLGSRRRSDWTSELAIPIELPGETRVGMGGPASGLSGWRLTHEQARAAVSVAGSGPRAWVRYADVALLASAVRDELLMTSLRKLYLEPLDEAGEGKALKGILRAYLTSNGSVTSAAAALGISRNTVTNRLKEIETKVGVLGATQRAAFAIALQLEDLTGFE